MHRQARRSLDCPAWAWCCRRRTRNTPWPTSRTTSTVGWYDAEQHTRIGQGVALDETSPEIAVAGDRIVVITVADAPFTLDTVLHGVDPTAGRLVAPTIDGSGKFEMSDLVVEPDAIYAAERSLVEEPVYQVVRRDPDRGTVLAAAPATPTSPLAAAFSSPARSTVASLNSILSRLSRSGCRSPG